jgi:hypothetical protein
MKHIELTKSEWHSIREDIRASHGASMIMLRNKMRRELGFTPRDHRKWIPKMDGGYYEMVVHLDFYSEDARTWFLLKYS